MLKLFLSDVRLLLQKYKPFENDMCEGYSNLKKTIRLKDERCQNATKAANAKTKRKVKGG